jgi:aminoglycoside phosphotransferase (APT) family kinase protein
MEYNLEKLKMLAQGGQAEIYEVEDNRVLRVLRDSKDEENLKNEIEILKALKYKGLTVPEVYGFTMIGDRPASIVERIYGDTMLKHIQKNPMKMKSYAKILAKLHSELLCMREDIKLSHSRQRASYLIKLSSALNNSQKEFVYAVLEELSEGDSICHGDFHPGNILMQDNLYYLIDWFGAYKGPAIADIAHTYLLMKNTPRIPGIGWIEYKIMKTFANLLAKTYIHELYRLQPFNWGEFSKWLVIKAAERTEHGMPMEQEKLVEYIDSCHIAMKKGVAADGWYLKL